LTGDHSKVNSGFGAEFSLGNRIRNLVWEMPPRGQRCRKSSDVGFMLGGRCGSLAVGASPRDAYTDGGRGDGP